MLKEKREQIEEELYRFVSTITQELKNSRDVLSMLEHYKENAGAAFRKELDIVCADMRSSSYEAALTRFEARLNSPQLSDVVRGLIGVLRADGSSYTESEGCQDTTQNKSVFFCHADVFSGNLLRHHHL